jgi:uncharacterized protein involved in tellurium resistance
MIDAVQPHKPDQDKVDGNDEVQQPRHNQDRDARDEGNDRRNVCGVRVMMIVGSYLVIAHRTCALAATIQKN